MSKKTKIVVSVLAIFAAGIIGVLVWQRELISAAIIAHGNSPNEILDKIEENRKAANDFVAADPEITVRELTDDEKRAIRSGELSTENAIKIIMGDEQGGNEILNADGSRTVTETIVDDSEDAKTVTKTETTEFDSSGSVSGKTVTEVTVDRSDKENVVTVTETISLDGEGNITGKTISEQRESVNDAGNVVVMTETVKLNDAGETIETQKEDKIVISNGDGTSTVSVETTVTDADGNIKETGQSSETVLDSQLKPEPEPEPEPEQSEYKKKLSEQIAQLYVLRETFTGELEKLEAEAIELYNATDDKASLKDVVPKYIARANRLELRCDNQVNVILKAITALNAEHEVDNSIVSTLRDEYAEEKYLTKAFYMSKLEKRGLA